VSLIIETGTGDPTSESYASVATAVTYAANHGLSFDGTDVPASEAALRRATSYIDFKYRLRFPGFRTNRHLQATEWPRSAAFYFTPSYIGESPYFVDPNAFYPFDFIATNSIPIEIINATCVAAVIELANPGTLVMGGIAPGTTGGTITKTKAGSVEIDYSGGTPLSISSPIVGQPVLAVLLTLLSPGSAYTARGAR
jgi:hypothetical protein